MLDRLPHAGRVLTAIGAIWLTLFAAMAAWSLTSGESPSQTWLLAFGILAMSLGAHLIYYRHEVGELAKQQSPVWTRARFWHRPTLVMLFGIVTLSFGAIATLASAMSIVRR